LALAWAGWLCDFYDLVLYSFLLILSAAELHFSKLDRMLTRTMTSCIALSLVIALNPDVGTSGG